MNTVTMIGRAGRSRQHPVYMVKRGDKFYTVCPGTREVTRVAEARIGGKISRKIERIGGPLFDTLIAQALAFAKERD